MPHADRRQDHFSKLLRFEMSALVPQNLAPSADPTLESRRGVASLRAGGILLAPLLAIVLVAPGQAEPDPERHARAVKQAIVAFAASALTVRENPQAPPPHMEVLFEVETRDESLHAHHLPGWLRVSLDKHPAIEHSYTDEEWHALADGALHLLLTAPYVPGARTLTVHFKGIDRNGKPYLRTKTFSLETARPSDHRVLRFRAAANEEPTLSLDALGESLLRSTAGQPTDELLYRIGRFESASGNHAAAAAFYFAALDPRVVGPRQPETRLRLAEAYAAVGAPEEADRLLERVGTESADAGIRARAWFAIERIAAAEGRHERVLQAHARIASSLSPESAGEANALAGSSALALRAYSQAAGFFRAVPKGGVDAPFAQFGQAQALAGQGDAFTAGTLFAKLGDTRSLFNPVQSRITEYAHAALGFQMITQGRYEEAIVPLGRVPSDHPLSDTALFAIGWCLRETGEHVKAIAVFDDLVARAPEGRYAHEARLATAASYADLRATTRSVAAYRASLDALSASTTTLERLHERVRGPAWDPLTAPDARGATDVQRLLNDPSIVRALERHRWLVRFGKELQKALDRFPEFLSKPQGSATLGGRLQTVDGSHLVNQGQDLLARLEVVQKESRDALSALITQTIARERARLEEWSIAASLGIARNLRDDLGGEALIIE